MEEKKLNILIVHNYYRFPGGEGTVVENEKSMLEDNGHKVFLYTRNNNEINNYSIIGKILLPFNYLFNIKTYFEIIDIIKKNKIDIVHVHNTVNIISKSVYYASKKCNTPILQTMHNFRFICSNGLLYKNGGICEKCLKCNILCAIKDKCYRNSLLETILSVINIKQLRKSNILNSMYFICFSEFNKNKLISINNICKKEVIDVNKIYIKENSTNSFVESIKLSNDRSNDFIYASRLDEGKGIKDLLLAWKNINTGRLIICGDGPEKEWCIDFVNRNDINNVIFLDNIEHDKLLKILSKSACLVYPTRYHETFGLSIVEAFSVGTPVIVADSGNAGELVKDNITGYKYKYGCIDDLKEKISNFSKKDNVSKNCYKEYKNRYTNSINYQKLMDIYYDVISKK